MSADLQQFEFDGMLVRTVLVNGDPWFVAKDVATVLGYSHTPHLTRTLDADEKGVRGTDTLGGQQDVTVISEGGLYKAIVQRQTGRMVDERMRSQVKAFQRWVTHEVLPAIRRTGTYIEPTVAPAPMTDDEIVHQALQITAAKVQALEEKVAQLTPDATFAQTVLSAEGT